MKNNTVPILYSAGTYGTFVEWCLYYFAGKIGEGLPFTSTGSAHKYKGNQLHGITSWRAYCKNPTHSIIRTHLKLSRHDSVVNNIDEIANSARHAILLHPSDSTILLTLNNKYEKVWGIGWLRAMNHLFADRLAGWGSRNISDLEPWQVRDFLSGYLLDDFNTNVDYPAILSYSHPHVTKISVDQLVSSFEPTVRNLLDICQFDTVRTNFTEVYNKWISVQRHVNKDSLVADIVDCVAHNRDCNWADKNLTIVDEAFVQMRLRVLHNLGLRCYNLNVFPTSTKELRKFLTNE